MFRYLTIALVIILALLQYRLWIGHDGLHEYYALKREVTEQKQQNQQLEKRNQALGVEINDLKEGRNATEEDARNQLGMIKPSEVFYQVTAIGSKNPKPSAQENDVLQKLIPLFANKMSCQIGDNKIQQWDIKKDQAKFSIAWAKQCGPVIDGIHQLGDNGYGSTFVCQNKDGKTCCWPLGYRYAKEFVICH